MKINPKAITGLWDKGFALDKHTLSSNFVGEDENGRAQFDTTRSKVGEALFQLKYRSHWASIAPLAAELARGAKTAFGNIDMVVPMPASNVRSRQPVTDLAREVARQLGQPMNATLLQKTPTSQLKDLNTREEKDAVLTGAFSIHPGSLGSASLDVLLVDDLVHTGASLDAACAALRNWGKVGRLYVAVLTWR